VAFGSKLNNCWIRYIQIRMNYCKNEKNHFIQINCTMNCYVWEGELQIPNLDEKLGKFDITIYAMSYGVAVEIFSDFVKATRDFDVGDSESAFITSLFTTTVLKKSDNCKIELFHFQDAKVVNGILYSISDFIERRGNQNKTKHTQNGPMMEINLC